MVSESHPAKCACGRTYHGRAWTALPRVRLLRASNLDFVLRWPERRAVDVRRCRCGRELARLVASAPASLASLTNLEKIPA